MAKPKVQKGAKCEPVPKVDGVINDIKWSCNVAMIVESEMSYVVFTQMFHEAAKNEQRPFIKSINLPSLIDEVKRYKVPPQVKEPTENKTKGKKGDKDLKISPEEITHSPDDSKIVENRGVGIEQYCMKILKTKDAVIPTDIMALLIKSKILKLKEECLKSLDIYPKPLTRKEGNKSEVVSGDKKNTKTKPEQKEKKTEKKTIGKSEDVSKKGKKSEKVNSEPKIIANDEQLETNVTNKTFDNPIIGPDLYIVISGFYDAQLPIEMIRVGIPLNGVIRLENDNQKTKLKMLSVSSSKQVLQGDSGAEDIDSLGKTSTSTKQSSAKKPGKKKNGFPPVSPEVEENIVNFWACFDNNVHSQVNVQLTSGLLTTSIVLPFKPALVDPMNTEKQNEIYDNFSFKIYDIQNIIREHNHYKRHMKVLKFGDMILWPDTVNVYESMVELVPLECTSIEYILHCIIEQVSLLSATRKLSDSYEVQSKKESDINSRCNHKTNESAILPDLTPTILKHGDTIRINTFHIQVPEVDLAKITSDLLSGMPVVRLWDLYPNYQVDPTRVEMEYQCQKLLKNWPSSPISRNLFLIYLHQFIFHQMQSLHNNLDRSEVETMDETMSEENQKFLICSENVIAASFSDSDIADEEHVMKHQTLADKMFVREQQLVALKRFLECSMIKSLIDNFNFSLTPNFTVSNKADMNYYHFIEEMDRHNLFQAFHASLFTFNTVEYAYYPLTDKILLWFYNNKNCEGLNEYLVTAPLLTPVELRDHFKYVSIEQASWISSQQEAMKQEEAMALLSDGIQLLSEDNQSFSHIGYDLGPSRVQVTERSMQFFSENATNVTVKSNDWLYGSKLLSLYISELGNILTFHKYLRHDINSAAHNSHLLSVRFETSNGTIFNILKPANELEEVRPNVDGEQTTNSNEKIRKGSNKNLPQEFNKDSKSTVDTIPILPSLLLEASNQVTSVCDINICLPSGLLIEVVRDEITGDPFYIRQGYTVKGSNTNQLIMHEDYRCYLRNGTVLIFYLDGRVEILCSNTTRVICKGFERPDPPTSKIEFLVDAKSKKGNKSKNEIKPTASVKSEITTQISDLKGTKKSKSKSLTSTDLETVEPMGLKVLEHNVITWSGENLKFVAGQLFQVEKQFPFRTAMDLTNWELYTTRGDGSATLLTSSSQLCVEFGDGTRITNELNIEPDKATVESVSDTEPKLELYDKNTEYNDHRIRILESRVDPLIPKSGYKFSDIKNTSEHGSKESTLYSLNIEEDEFVSITQGVCMEHPCYATVEYIPHNNTIQLSLPGRISIVIFPNGTYNIEVEEKTTLCLSEIGIEFSRTDENLVKHSVSTLNWTDLVSSLESNVLSQTIDGFNHIFKVYCNGETEKTTVDFEDKILSDCPEEISLNEPYKERFFIFNRNLSGYEMLHTGCVLSHLKEMSQTNNFFDIENQIEKESPDLRLLTTQRPLFINHSEEFIMQYRLGLPCIRPSFLQRKDLNPPWFSHLSPWLFDAKGKKTNTRPSQLNNGSSNSVLTPIADSNTCKETFRAVVIRNMKQIAEIVSDALTEIAKTLQTYDDANQKVYEKYIEQTIQEIQSEEEVAEQYNVLSVISNAVRTDAKQYPHSPLGWEAIESSCSLDKED